MGISGLGNVHGGSLLRALAARTEQAAGQGAGGGAAATDGETTRASGRRRGAGRAEAGAEAAADGGAGRAHRHGGGGGGAEGAAKAGHKHGAKDADAADEAGGARGARGADDADEVDDADGADEAEDAGDAGGAGHTHGAQGGGRAEGGGGGGGGGCDGEAGADDAEIGAVALNQPAVSGAVAPIALAPTTSVEAAATGLATTQASAATGLLASAAAAVPNSQIATQVFAAVQAGGAQVNVVDDAAFAAKYGRASGVYDPATNQISLPASVAANPAEAGLILLHEGVHWLQHNTQGGLDALGGAIGTSLQQAGASSTATGAKAVQQQDEAQAYLLEALAASQAGVKDGGMGTTTSGTLATYAQIQQAVRATPEYA